MVWAIARYMVKALFLAGHAIVILDATNVTRHRRSEWLSKDWVCSYKVFDAPCDVCIARPGGKELSDVILRMSKQWEDLTDAEQRRLIG
jgi:predicted kinase